jgi:hypothetical protein
MRTLDAAPWRDQSLGGRGACEADGKGADVACHLGDTAGRRRARSKHAPLAKEQAQMAVLYPLEFYRRSDREWKSRVTASARPEDDTAAANRGNECCPNCCLPVARPFVSSYLHGCVVEHHWLCKTCEVSWTTRFDPLLV